jgi:cell division protein FtsQ
VRSGSSRRLGRKQPLPGEVGGVAAKRRSRASPTAATIPAPRTSRSRLDTPAWFPSLSSALAALGILVAGLGLYVGARETSVFAIDRIEVDGVPPGTAARVRSALAPLSGSSLVAFDSTDGDRRLAALAIVASATYDRKFPHTLRVSVKQERAIGLLRRGRDTWVVSDSARVLRKVRTQPLPRLPRIWLPASADPLVGAVLADSSVDAVRALVPIARARLSVSVRSVRVVEGEISMVLASGTEVLLGDASQLRLKLAVVSRILPLAGDLPYLDVSVPDRAVAGNAQLINPQLES